MADDLISRQAAIELVMEYCPDDDGSVGELGDLRELLDELENLPSAQRTGRWEPVSMQTNNEVVYRCSVCDKLLWLATDHCPHCGARMEAE